MTRPYRYSLFAPCEQGQHHRCAASCWAVADRPQRLVCTCTCHKEEAK